MCIRDRYVYDTGIVKKERFSVETLAGPMIAELTVENGVCTHVRVNMGKPFFNRADIPVVGEGECQLQTLTALDKTFTFSTILLGVPHTVVFVDDVLGLSLIHISTSSASIRPLRPWSATLRTLASTLGARPVV